MTAVLDVVVSEAERVAEMELLRELTWATSRQRREALQVVSVADYQIGRHRTIHEAVVALEQQSLPVDYPDVVDQLDRAGHLEHVGGLAFLSQVLGRSPIAVNPARVARRVHAAARRRRAIAAADELTRALVDADDLAETLHAGVEALLTHARDGEADGLVSVRDVSDEIDVLHEVGNPSGFRCGWQTVDRLYRPDLRQLTVVTGVPSHGKSSWLDAYLVRLADRHGWRFVLFSPERAGGRKGIAKHAVRLMVLRLGVPLAEMTVQQREESKAWVYEHFEWIDDTDRATVAGILAAARLACDRSQRHGLVIDPWNWVEPNRRRDQTAHDAIGQSLNQLIRFSIDHDLHTWVVAHPTKLRQHDGGEKAGTYYVPRPYDIADSSHWFNKPWFCLAVWRDHLAVPHGEPGSNPDRDPLLVDVHVQKVREDEQGQIGVASLRFDLRTRRYHPVDFDGGPL